MKHYDREEGERRIAKLEERAERRSGWAAGRRSKTAAAHQQAHNLTDPIPMGQPIQPGRRGQSHRNRLAKGRAALGRAVEHADMAEHHQGIADRAEVEIAEIERRMAGPAYDKTSGLRKGDRIADSVGEAERGLMSAVVIRANTKSVSVQPCYTCPAGTPLERILFPRDGWLTYVDAAQVASPNPGYCFKAAGWALDRGYHPDRRRSSLIRLRSDLLLGLSEIDPPDWSAS